jgi:hypothetical protein
MVGMSVVGGSNVSFLSPLKGKVIQTSRTVASYTWVFQVGPRMMCLKLPRISGHADLKVE